MEINYREFLPLVKALLSDDNVLQMLRPPLSEHFNDETQLLMRKSLNCFFEEFDKVKEYKKYADFMEVTKDISEWIPLFLGDTAKAKECRKKFNVIFQLIHIQAEGAVNSFPMNEVFLHKCQNNGLISKQARDDLIRVGATTAKYKFLWEISIKSQNYYGKLLQLLYEEKTNYIENFCDDLHKSIAGVSHREAKNYITAYAKSIINKNMNVNIGEDEVFNNVESDGGPGLGTEGETRVKDDFPSILDVNMNERTLEDANKDFDNLECDGRPGEVLDDRNCLSVEGEVLGDRNCPAVEELLSLNEEMITDTVEAQRPGASAKDEENAMDSDDEDNADPENCDNLFGELKDKHVDDILNFSSESKISRIKDTNVLNVRKYQEELADEGIKGQNVLICAPTGSGKTVVAVKIVEEHLKRIPNAKVAFVVHRIALVEQQYAQFSKYLNCKITRLSGSMKAACAPLVGHIPCFDVFVMTSDILRNALEQENETKLQSLNSFTMILFDECHNCDKKHPYNQIMNHYFKTKRDEGKVPQIIGLTASTGTNKANTMQIAMKRLYTLCANLDTYTVSTVKKYVEELCTNQSKPINDVILAQSRVTDNFEVELQNQMKTCEKYLHEMNKRDFFPKDPATQLIFSIPEDRMHQKYSGFVGKLNNLLNVTKNDYDGKLAIYAIAQYLNAFVRALMVNHLFRAQDAIKIIKDYLNLDNESSSTCDVEKNLRRSLKKLEKASLLQPENPCLATLQNRIVEQLNEDNSRIIVFVRERAYTQILKDVFTSLNNPKIKCDTIVGNTISAEKGGLTQNEMEEVLGRFRSGECNVLFSTTVAEEGLDVQQCNLVIRYGHVTNETAMVQSRGRARAKDSKYVVIVPNKLQWQINKENINKYRESMMYRAIEKFQTMNENERKNQIDECSYERLLMETVEKTKKLSLANNPNAQLVRTFSCKKCSTEICNSTDIRLVEKAHHLVINVSTFDKMVANPKNNQISCKKCSNQLGNRQIYKGRGFPNLTISAFSVSCESQGTSRSFKKWRDIDFEVAPVQYKELLDFNPHHSLSA